MLTSQQMATPLPFYVRENDPPAKRHILRAAMQLFADHGLAGTSIRDIARESGYTNPALYKHFASKEELALHLFETCHQRLWTKCHAAITGAKSFENKLEAYIAQVLELVDEHPEAMAFLSDSARVLWPKAGSTVRRRTMISLAREVMSEGPRPRRGAPHVNPDVAAASLQGTLAELARMLKVGVIQGPAIRWHADLVALFRRVAG
jgi:TetR/AcrR family transcriptional regulator, repressor of fatR-cypB operon